jgi:predicted DNA-binding protein
MYKTQQQMLLGARIPASLKERLLKYCVNHGVKMNYFVTEAIKARLEEIAEDNHLAALAGKRLKKANFISQEEFNKYLLKRGIKH